MGKPEDDIAAAGVIAIIRAPYAIDLARVAQALLAGGIAALEITLNTPGALAGIAALRRTLEGRCRVGAGTVLSDADARSATDAGAEYLVTPVFDERVLAAAGARSVPVVCGCTTPSEMLAAHRAGAAFIKLFPATRFGPTFVRDLLGPLPMLRIVPTGGVSANNAAEYIRAGAAAVAAGGKLVDLDAIRSGEWSALSERARALVEAVAGARGGRGEQGRQA